MGVNTGNENFEGKEKGIRRVGIKVVDDREEARKPLVEEKHGDNEFPSLIFSHCFDNFESISNNGAGRGLSECLNTFFHFNIWFQDKDEGVLSRSGEEILDRHQI